MNNSQQFFTDNELSAKFYPIISSKYPNFDKMEEFEFRQIQEDLWYLQANLFIEYIREKTKGMNSSEREQFLTQSHEIISFSFESGPQIEPVQYLRDTHKQIICAFIESENPDTSDPFNMTVHTPALNFVSFSACSFPSY